MLYQLNLYPDLSFAKYQRKGAKTRRRTVYEGFLASLRLCVEAVAKFNATLDGSQRNVLQVSLSCS